MPTPSRKTPFDKPTPDDIADGVVAEDESLWERRMRILTMRNAGRTISQIVEALKNQGVSISATTVRKDIKAALAEVIGEAREDMIARQRSVLLDFQRANYFDAINTDPDKFDRRITAQKQILAQMDHEARLFGLYSPTKVQLGISDREFAAETAALIEELGLQPPKELTAAITRALESDAAQEVIDVEAESVDDPRSEHEVTGGQTDEQPPLFEMAVPDRQDVPAASEPAADGWSNV